MSTNDQPNFPLLTEAERAELEEAAVALVGSALIDKMERAGAAVAAVAARLLGDVAGRYVLVLAGVGNNGAAGLAAARHLHEAGATVRLILAAPRARLHAMAAHQLAILEEMGLEPWGLSLAPEKMDALEPVRWTEADLIIDAILGSGIEGDPRGDMADLIRLANAARRPILALDVPSGLSGDEGYILSPCVDARATVALGVPRRVLAEGWPVVGTLWVADVGLPAGAFAQLGLAHGAWFDEGGLAEVGSARSLR